jgi:hypothetical protein
VGPDGEPVFDSFYFVHQPLAGNGSITARVTSMTGLVTYPPAHPNAIVPGGPPLGQGGLTESGGRFTVSGSGDIAPLLGAGRTIGDTLRGTFAGLIVVIVVGAMFVTAEYRRGLIRTTLAASPRRGRVLAAKAIVIGSAVFVAGLAGAVDSVPPGQERHLPGRPRSTLDPGGQGPRLGPAAPRDQDADNQERQRYGGTGVQDKRVGDGRPGRQASQPECGQPGKGPDQHSDPPRQFERADQVPEPLAGPDLGEHVHHGVRAAELHQPADDEHEGQDRLKNPQDDSPPPTGFHGGRMDDGTGSGAGDIHKVCLLTLFSHV